MKARQSWIVSHYKRYTVSGGSWLSYEYFFSCCSSCFHDAFLDKFVLVITVKESFL